MAKFKNTRTGDRLSDGSLVVNASRSKSVSGEWVAPTGAALDNFRVLDGWILFEREDQITKVGKIELVGKSDKDRRYRPTPARVIQVGPADQTSKGGFVKPTLKVGDRVVLNRFAGHDIELGGRLYVVAVEDDVTCVIGEDTRVSEVV